VARATNNRGEDGAGRVVAGEARLAHARAVVHDQSLNLVVSHAETVYFLTRKENDEGWEPSRARQRHCKDCAANSPNSKVGQSFDKLGKTSGVCLAHGLSSGKVDKTSALDWPWILDSSPFSNSITPEQERP